MKIERTTDPVAIRAIIGHPRVKPLVLEGDDVPVPLHESIYHLLGKVGGKVAGVVCFIQIGRAHV